MLDEPVEDGGEECRLRASLDWSDSVMEAAEKLDVLGQLVRIDNLIEEAVEFFCLQLPVRLFELKVV